MAMYELTELFNFAGRAAEMLDVADNMVASFPLFPMGWVAKAHALCGLGRSCEALDVCDEGIRKFPSPGYQALLRRERASALRDAAAHSECDQSREMYEQAVADAQYASAEGLISPEMILAHVASLMSLGRSEDACTVALEGAAGSPSTAEVLHACACALAASNRDEELLDLEGIDRLLCVRSFASNWFDVATGWAKRHRDLDRDGKRSFRAVFDALNSDDFTAWADEERVKGLRLLGLSKLGQVSRELGLQADALELLRAQRETYAEMPEYWFTCAALSADTGEYGEARRALDELYSHRGTEEVLREVAATQADADHPEVCPASTVLPDSLAILAMCDLADGNWEKSLAMVNWRQDHLCAEGQERDFDLALAITVILNTPEAASLSAAAAKLVLKLCLNLERLGADDIKRVGGALGRFDLGSALESCAGDEHVAVALAAMLIRDELLSVPAIAALAPQAERVRSALRGKEAHYHEDLLVRSVASSFLEDDV